jgi:hypothetical protein
MTRELTKWPRLFVWQHDTVSHLVPYKHIFMNISQCLSGAQAHMRELKSSLFFPGNNPSTRSILSIMKINTSNADQ